MDASRITLWKNVNGIYTADPRRVPEAFPIESLKYDEAIELAYFGAQVHRMANAGSFLWYALLTRVIRRFLRVGGTIENT